MAAGRPGVGCVFEPSFIRVQLAARSDRASTRTSKCGRRKHSLRAFFGICCGLLALGFVSPGWAATQSELPNVVVILGDDMGLDSVSAFNSEMGLETPAIDSLARDGMSFLDAHSTSSVCSPTRYSLLTGRYSWRSRLKRGIVGMWERPLIEDGRVSLPGVFREHGYQTAMIGKWHLGWHWPKLGGGTTESLQEIDFNGRVAGGPNSIGFEYYFGDDVPNWPPYIWRENDRLLGAITSQMKAGLFVGVSPGPSVEDWDFRAVLREYGRRCSQYVRDRAADDRPFFLYFPMPSPHTPIAPHQEFRGRTGVSEYADFLVQTDSTVQEILTALDETGQADNTVVIFTCDNGTSPKANFSQLDEAGVHLNVHWRGWKADAYEGGHRVPFIVRWPQQVAAGSQSLQVITLADVMATCADLISHDLPDDAAEDSVSLLPTLLGKDAAEPLHDFVIHHSVSGQFCVRQGDWKLLLCRGSGGWSPPREAAAKQQGAPPLQLYNLREDPRETRNLGDRYPGRVRELVDLLAVALEQGRTTPGSSQSNDGWPNTIAAELLDRFPQLQPSNR